MKLSLRAVLLLASATSVACGGRGRHYDVIADPAFSPEEMEQVLAGREKWASAVPIRANVFVSECSGVEDGKVCLHRSSLAGIAAVFGEPEKDVREVIGTTSTRQASDGSLNCLRCVDGGEVWLAMDAPSISACEPGKYSEPSCGLRTAWEHEYGHAMGLEHEPSTATEKFVMDPGWGTSALDVTEGDARQWWSLR